MTTRTVNTPGTNRVESGPPILLLDALSKGFSTEAPTTHPALIGAVIGGALSLRRVLRDPC